MKTIATSGFVLADDGYAPALGLELEIGEVLVIGRFEDGVVGGVAGPGGVELGVSLFDVGGEDIHLAQSVGFVDGVAEFGGGLLYFFELGEEVPEIGLVPVDLFGDGGCSRM